jgi:hypothetical protein
MGMGRRMGAIGAISLLVMILVGAVIVGTQFVGPAKDFRDRAVSTMRAQFSQIPSCKNIPPDDTTVFDPPFRAPQIQVSYEYDAQCPDVITFYTTQLQQAGWTASTDWQVATGGFDTADYDKSVQGFALTLEVQCNSQPAQGNGCILTMTAR